MQTVTLRRLLHTDFHKINDACTEWYKQTKADDREECFEHAFHTLGLKEIYYGDIPTMPHILKVYVLYHWLTTNNYIQGEPVTKGARNKVKHHLK